MDRSRAILIIDDNEDDRLLFRRALSHNPDGLAHFTEAGSGASGLEAMALSRPDCVLLDYSLPGQNGLEILKRIRALYPFLPVIMLTGQGNELIAVQSIKDGAQDYIVKGDITSETLERVVRTSISHCALEKRIDEQRAALALFTRALAHDLKEPVRTIRSYVDIMASDDNTPDEMDTYYTFVRNAADRLAIIIDTVFLYTKLDGIVPGGSSDCDMTDVCTAACDNLALLIREHDAVITCHGLPKVNARPAHMIQMLQNLFVNAIRHTPGPVMIDVRAVRQGAEWVFAVTDTGPGIAADYLEQIFAPFRRLSSNEDGAGLGLAICRKIVELSGGQIWCESEPGEGTTFFFRLPCIDDVDAAPVQTLPERQRLAVGTLHRLARLLVVDDRKADVELTRMLLMEVGLMNCELLVAFDGKQALGVLQEAVRAGKPVDLMLLDINMPVMNGLELLERMAGDAGLQATSVVMCSGSGDDGDIDRARALGAKGYLQKPPRLEQLLPIIDSLSNVVLEETRAGYDLYGAI